MLNYDNRCGSCGYFGFVSDYKKGYCEYYKAYYYPDDSCYHYKDRSPSGGCYITTIVCDILGKEDDCDVLNTLRSFRNNYMQKNAEYSPLLMEYDVIGPKIAEAIRNDYTESDKSFWEDYYDIYLMKTCDCIKNEEFNEAIKTYINMVESLKKYYSIPDEKIEIENYDFTKGGHGKVKVK